MPTSPPSPACAAAACCQPLYVQPSVALSKQRPARVPKAPATSHPCPPRVQIDPRLSPGAPRLAPPRALERQWPPTTIPRHLPWCPRTRRRRGARPSTAHRATRCRGPLMTRAAPRAGAGPHSPGTRPTATRWGGEGGCAAAGFGAARRRVMRRAARGSSAPRGRGRGVHRTLDSCRRRACTQA